MEQKSTLRQSSRLKSQESASIQQFTARTEAERRAGFCNFGRLSDKSGLTPAEIRSKTAQTMVLL